MTIGRPSKYDPAFCDAVIEFMGRGYSLTAFAGHICVARSTLNEWMGTHNDFSEAVKIAQSRRTVHLETRLLSDATPGPAITGTIFALKNAAPGDWRDKQEIEHTGKLPSLRVEFVSSDESPE